jgi:hypothetical protein
LTAWAISPTANVHDRSEAGTSGAATRALSPLAGHLASLRFRLQGPDLLLEYDNTQRQVNHVHPVWRSPASDFGIDTLAEHRSRHRHGWPAGVHPRETAIRCR